MLKFGTSGVRGLVKELTDKECYRYTMAFLQYLSAQKLIKKNTPVAIAGDFRPSTGRILTACRQAIKDFGLPVDVCGIIPTPAVSLYGFTRRIPSIMVTGSHIPFDRNGIKFNLPKGEILKKDEKVITEIYIKLTEDGYGDELFKKNGSLINAERLPKVNTAAKCEYVERYLSFFEPKFLKGKTIVVYQHSSVIRDIMAEIFKKLGANVIPVERSEKFIPIDTEAMREIDLRNARKWAKQYKPDAIVSADGDGDRPVLFDETGGFIRGDALGVLCAAYLKADSVSATASCNTALELCGKFPRINRTRIGSPYVIEAMYADQERKCKQIVSYEANGGFLTCNNFSVAGRRLQALPTRDAMLPVLCALALAKEQGMRLSELWGSYPQRYVYSHSLKGFPTEMSQDILKKISSKAASSKKLAKELFSLPADVRSFDFTDGARMTLANGEIVHVRPSSNAPELRVYTEADTLDRAQDIAEHTLNILSQMAS